MSEFASLFMAYGAPVIGVLVVLGLLFRLAARWRDRRLVRASTERAEAAERLVLTEAGKRRRTSTEAIDLAAEKAARKIQMELVGVPVNGRVLTDAVALEVLALNQLADQHLAEAELLAMSAGRLEAAAQAYLADHDPEHPTGAPTPTA